MGSGRSSGRPRLPRKGASPRFFAPNRPARPGGRPSPRSTECRALRSKHRGSHADPSRCQPRRLAAAGKGTALIITAASVRPAKRRRRGDVTEMMQSGPNPAAAPGRIRLTAVQGRSRFALPAKLIWEYGFCSANPDRSPIATKTAWELNGTRANGFTADSVDRLWLVPPRSLQVGLHLRAGRTVSLPRWCGLVRKVG